MVWWWWYVYQEASINLRGWFHPSPFKGSVQIDVQMCTDMHFCLF